MVLVINSSTIGDGGVEAYCAREEIPVLMSLPWDRRIAEQYSAGRLILQNLREYREVFESLYANIMKELATHETADCHKR